MLGHCGHHMQRVAGKDRRGRLQTGDFDQRDNGIAVKSAEPDQPDGEREGQRTMGDTLPEAASSMKCASVCNW